MTNKLYPLTLYFDGACPMCRNEMRSLQARDAHGRLRFEDVRADGFLPPAGATPAAMLEAIHGRAADGRLVVGVEALRLANRAIGLGWLLAPILASLAIAIVAPLVAVAYLRPILMRVLQSLCDADGSAEFWFRCTTLLSVSGTLVLVTLLGDFGTDTSLVGMLRHTLLLAMTGVFASVAIVSRNVWNVGRRAQVVPAPQAVMPGTPGATARAAEVQ
jgi:predicted DCC family thiol-disulfide oxidoreductase YuxK